MLFTLYYKIWFTKLLILIVAIYLLPIFHVYCKTAMSTVNRHHQFYQSGFYSHSYMDKSNFLYSS